MIYAIIEDQKQDDSNIYTVGEDIVPYTNCTIVRPKLNTPLKATLYQ